MKYISTTEAAKKLGISRIAVFQHIQAGKLDAIKIGRNYAIPDSALPQKTSKSSEKEINEAVRRTVKEYGETLKLLSKE